MSCENTKQNIGIDRCNNLPGLIRTMILTPQDFVATEEQVVSQTFWQDALKAGIAQRIYKWPDFDAVENISEETVYEDTPLSYLHVRDGNYRFRFSLSTSMCLHKAMFSHRTYSGRVWLFDKNNQLIGTNPSIDVYKGLSLQLLNPEKLMFSDGSVSTKSPIVVALRDNLEIDEYGVTIKAAFINDLIPLTDATVTVVSAASDELVVDVKVTCDATPINGLVAADFVVLTGAGSTQAIDSVAEDDGRYTITPSSSFATGTVKLVAPEELSVDAYDGTTPATVTIGS